MTYTTEELLTEIDGAVGILKNNTIHDAGVELMWRAIRQIVEDSRWRDIETAPKDGTAIFVLSARQEVEGPDGETIVHQPRAYIAKWWADGDSWTDEYGNLDGNICTLTVTGVWECDGGWFQPNEVTHWRPLGGGPEGA